MSEDRTRYLTEHVAAYQVDAERVLKVFGLQPGDGCTGLTLAVINGEMVELTVKRHIKGAELEALLAALEKDPAPVFIEVKSVRHGGPEKI